MTGSPPPKQSSALIIAVVAALACVGALGWKAAEGGHGLDYADLRTVIVVSAAVFVSAWWRTRER
jgi:hypothetical protein